MLPPDVVAEKKDTGVDVETLKKVGGAITTLPDAFTPHRMVGKIYKGRNEMITSGAGIDWALAEQARALATHLLHPIPGTRLHLIT